MLRTTLRAAWSRKRRLFGTSLAVVLGVAFLAATLILGDTARAGFRVAFEEANAGTDAYVRSAQRFTGGDMAVTTPLPATDLDVVAAVAGVRTVVPVVEGNAQVLDADGSPIGGGGPPTTGAAWIDDPDLTGWDLVDGRAPAAAGEVVIDRATADEAGLEVGDTASILAPDRIEQEVVGIVAFGDKDSIGGTTFVAFTLPEAQRLMLGSTDVVTGIIAAADEGLTQAQLVDRITPALRGGAEAITGAALTQELRDDIEGDFLGAMTTGLLAFAGISLVVSAFSIFNTFTILLAQRTRESALLRALGASRRQVLGSAVIESAIVGIVGSLAGVVAGVFVASGLLSLLEGIGFGLPVDGLEVTPTALMVAGGVGLVVTVLGGLAPALRSARVAPLAALRDVAVDTSGGSRSRALVGGLVALGGAGLVVSSTRSDDGLPAAGLGALVFMTGIVLLGPVVARPVGRLVGAPLRLRGASGDLAARNAVRNPRRTASTAAALLVGVGVVSLFTVFGASLSKSIEDEVSQVFAGDVVLSSSGAWSASGLAPSTIDRVADLPEVAVAAGLGYGPGRLDGRDEDIDFTDPVALAAVSDFDVVAGSFEALDRHSIAMTPAKAAAHGWEIGDTIDLELVDGSHTPLTLDALFAQDSLGGNVFVSQDLWLEHDPQATFYLAFVDVADGTSVTDGAAAIERATGDLGSPNVMDRDEFVESQAGEVQTMLSVVYGLLAIAIVIALMGIANTLSLAVHERTRELGLLRAVGQTRRQLRAMIRWESMVVSTFGALGGLGVGLFLSWGLVRTLNESEGFGTYSVPVGSLVVILLLGAAVGVVAALRPAHRAAKLDVLTAIADT